MGYTKGSGAFDYSSRSDYRTYYDPISVPNWMRYSSLQAALLLSQGEAAKVGTPNSQFSWKNEIYGTMTANIDITVSGSKGHLSIHSGGSGDIDTFVEGVVFSAVGDPSQLYRISSVSGSTVTAQKYDSSSEKFVAITSSIPAFDVVILLRLGTLAHTLTDADVVNLAVSKDPDFATNYLTLIEHFAVTNKTDAATIVVPGANYTERERKQLQALYEAEKAYERALWAGSIVKDTNNSLQMSKGFVNFGVNNVTGTLSGYDWDDFNGFCRDYVTKYNNKMTLTAFANKRMLGVIGEMTRSQFNGRYDAVGKVVGDERYGMRVRKLTTDYIDLDIYENGALTDIYGSSKGILAVVDLPLVKIRYLEGNGISEDLHLDENLQSQLSRQIIDCASANIGLQLINPTMHSLLVLS